MCLAYLSERHKRQKNYQICLPLVTYLVGAYGLYIGSIMVKPWSYWWTFMVAMAKGVQSPSWNTTLVHSQIFVFPATPMHPLLKDAP